MKNIKAIETIYNGYRFRSRLEARWAVFFDCMGINYKYENEGFELIDGTKYLPDFYLPDYDLYVEVKPSDKERLSELDKCNLFCISDYTKRIVILGDIPPEDKRSPLYWFPCMYYNGLSQTTNISPICFADAEYFSYDIRYAKNAERSFPSLAIQYNRFSYKPNFLEENMPFYSLGYINDVDLASDSFTKSSVASNESCWSYAFDEEKIKKLQFSLRKARQARFEYGEHGGL